MDKHRMQMALGERKAPLVLKNARIADVFAGCFREADVAVDGDTIVGVGDYSGEEELELRGKTLIPGLIDAHMHFESSLVSPKLFLERIVPCGTTAVIADPHEIVNVAGAAGMEYLYEESKNIPARVFWMLPSCVPANALETNGAVFGAEEMRELAGRYELFGLGEVMDTDAVLRGDPEMEDKLSLFERIDGHAPGLSGKALCAYRLAGVQTDHECVRFSDALERIQMGFYVQIREGTAAKNLEELVGGILSSGVSTDRFLFCTDDMHLSDVRREGHINACVRKAIRLGMEPIKAIRMATLNPATAYGLTNLGAIAPGYRADLVVVGDVEQMEVQCVFSSGKQVFQKGKPFSIPGKAAEGALKKTVRLPPLDETVLRLRVHPDYPVMELVPGEILTRKRLLDPPEKDGLFTPGGELLKIAVVERHGRTGNIAVGILKGLGLKGGAIGATIAHDSHNLILTGDCEADMLLAAKELERCQGGYTLVSGGKVLMTQALPIAGLFTDNRDEDVEGNVAKMKELARRMGVSEGVDPFMTLSFLSLPVIPALRIIDAGLYDVENGQLIF